MMVMTAKVDMKKILLILGAVAAVILVLILMMGGSSQDTAATAGREVSGNDARVQFLRDFGWQVTTSPVESGQVKIPEESGEVFRRYNALQKQQGYDLTQYAGKNAMRYVYKVNNYPGATEPVYATLLVYKNEIIGGDVTDTSAGGHIRSLQMPENMASAPSESTASQPAR